MNQGLKLTRNLWTLENDHFHINSLEVPNRLSIMIFISSQLFQNQSSSNEWDTNEANSAKKNNAAGPNGSQQISHLFFPRKVASSTKYNPPFVLERISNCLLLEHACEISDLVVLLVLPATPLRATQDAYASRLVCSQISARPMYPPAVDEEVVIQSLPKCFKFPHNWRLKTFPRQRTSN